MEKKIQNEFFYPKFWDARKRKTLLVSCAASHAANINNNANEDCVKHTQIDKCTAECARTHRTAKIDVANMKRKLPRQQQYRIPNTFCKFILLCFDGRVFFFISSLLIIFFFFNFSTHWCCMCTYELSFDFVFCCCCFHLLFASCLSLSRHTFFSSFFVRHLCVARGVCEQHTQSLNGAFLTFYLVLFNLVVDSV